MKTDPFFIKQYPKWHIERLAFTFKARLIEKEANLKFNNYALPEAILPNLPPIPDVDYSNTAVTPIQMQHLLAGLSATEHLKDTVVVEIGCYRGLTTKTLAKATSRRVIAIDPYIGYGGSEEDYQFFIRNTAELPNVFHERKTSGEASKNWNYNPISFVFIDALHDYVNTAFDIETWSSLLVKGGILACHDTDQKRFAGTRKAVFEVANLAKQFAHPNNLTMFSFEDKK
jgi:predicted O-methyltransferase YrrM